jgi:predicted peptidase
MASACARRSVFIERSVRSGEHTYNYRVWLPHHYSKLHHWPVVLYLHGSAERGDDGVRPLANGLPLALQRYGERYKCIVVIPQAAFGHEWYGEMELQALAALDATVREFHGDPRRIYLTGISMGGAGAWYLARHRKFAAVLPVAGEVVRQPDDPWPSDPPPELARIAGSPDPYATLATEIGPTPVWAFHGAKDDVIPPTESRKMTAALPKARYTEYPDAGHDIWDRVYGDREVVHWMLRQRTGR